MMERLIKYLALVMLFSSCQLLRKTKTESSDSRAQLTTMSDVVDQRLFNQESERKVVLLMHDSSDTQRLITISPKGVFKLSLDSGFTGEALEIQINEKSKRVARLNEHLELKESLRDSASRTSATKEKLSIANKAKSVISSPATFPTMLAIVLTCAIAVAAYRLLKKQ